MVSSNTHAPTPGRLYSHLPCCSPAHRDGTSAWVASDGLGQLEGLGGTEAGPEPSDPGTPRDEEEEGGKCCFSRFQLA